MILIDSDDQIIEQGQSNWTDFHYSLLPKNSKLSSGTYTLIIDADWHESASYESEYKNVLLRIFTGQKVDIKELTQQEGESKLRAAIPKFAMRTEFAEQRTYYRENDPDFGQDLWYLATPNIHCGSYFFAYKRNDSSTTSTERVRFIPSGMQVVGEIEEQDEEGYTPFEPGTTSL